MPTKELLRVKNLTIGFGEDEPVVNQLSFSIHRGKTLALVGESGSGKSLSARSILGLLPRTAAIRTGSILWQSGQGEASERESLELVGLPDRTFREIRSKAIGMIFQEPLTALNPTQKVGRQLLENTTGTSRMAKKTQVLEWLRKVKLPEPERIFTAFPHELSGGQRQRVLIAQAMLPGPALLIADEPTTALDTVTEAAIIRLLRQMVAEEKTALLFISHDLAVVREIADEMLLLDQGQTVERGGVASLLKQPETEYTQRLIGASARLNFTAPKADAGRNDEPETVLSAREVSVYYPLAYNWLGKPTAVLKAVNKVDLELLQGTFVALVGESGCGKSTFARTICGLTPANAGDLTLDGQQLSLAAKGDWGRANRLKVQLIFQDPFSSLNPVHSVGEVIAEVIGVRDKQLTQAVCEERAASLLDRVGLPAVTFYDRLPHELSGGQRQRVAIARALAAKPKVLVCDEAVSALDASLQLAIMKLLRKLVEEENLAILFISHDLALVGHYADQVLVMHKGEIVERGTPAVILTQPKHPQSQRLLAAINFH